VNKIFGFMLLGLAIYMLDRVVPYYISGIMSIALLVGFFVFLQKTRKTAESRASLILNIISVMVILYAISLSIGVFKNDVDYLHPYKYADKKDIKEYSLGINTTGKSYSITELQNKIENNELPTIVYVTAKWCISCSVLKRGLLKDKEVLAMLQNINFIVVNVTENNKNDKELQNKYKVIGPPTFIFYNKNKEELASSRVSGSISKIEFLSRIRLQLK
jgi:thiol:disulfide interchange protein DsbD